ncbi:unnamed protein product, partial [Hymenolepis diminuta]
RYTLIHSSVIHRLPRISLIAFVPHLSLSYSPESSLWFDQYIWPNQLLMFWSRTVAAVVSCQPLVVTLMPTSYQ